MVIQKNLQLDLIKIECPYCKYRWLPRTSTPKRCPYCEKYLLNPKENAKNNFNQI